MDKRRLERRRKEKGERGRERAKLDVARVSGISSLSLTRRYTHIIQIVRTYTSYLLGSERVTVYTIYLGRYLPVSCNYSLRKAT